MALPFLNIFKKSPPREYFLGLLLGDGEIRAVVFEEIEKNIQIIGEGKAELTESIDTVDDEKFLEAADKAISIAENPLPPNITTHKTVFGLKETWVENAKIKSEHLARLKKLSDALELTPIGFLVFSEAVAHLLEREEGAPVSGLLVAHSGKNIAVTLIRAGRVIETQTSALGESTPKTVDKLLMSFSEAEILPSRIILVGGDPDEPQEFVRHSWTKSLPFLHVPQITPLSEDSLTKAILFGTAAQMGFDALGVIQAAPRIEEKEEPELFKKAHELQKVEEEFKPAEKEEVVEEKENMEHGEIVDKSEDFGFVKGKDVATSLPEKPKLIRLDNAEELSAEIPEEVKEEETGFLMQKETLPKDANLLFGGIKKGLPDVLNSIVSGFGKIGSIVKMISFPQKGLFLIIGIVILILLICGSVWYFMGIKASVTLSLSPKVAQNESDVTFTPSGTTNLDKSIIAGKTVDVTETGSASGNATGKKDTGNKAKGTVTIFNNSDTSRTLQAGTTITSSTGLNFTLDKDVSIASASGDVFSGTTPGTADVTVTASSFGTDYNLPSATKFSISSSSTIAAKNSNAFSGGTKKTVTVFSKDDATALVNQLAKNLESQARSDLTKQLGKDEDLLSSFISEDGTKTTFDKNVGDEASSVSLTGTIDFKSIVLAKGDELAFAKKVLGGQLPGDMTIMNNKLETSISDVTVKGDNVNGKLTVKANLLPAVDAKDIAKRIAGKSFSQAQDILSGIPQFSGVKIVLSPSLFFLPKNLPASSSNINVFISAND